MTAERKYKTFNECQKGDIVYELYFNEKGLPSSINSFKIEYKPKEYKSGFHYGFSIDTKDSNGKRTAKVVENYDDSCDKPRFGKGFYTFTTKEETIEMAEKMYDTYIKRAEPSRQLIDNFKNNL